jgi:replicative DNA helicase
VAGWTKYLNGIIADVHLDDAMLRPTAKSLANANMLRGLRSVFQERLRELQGISPTRSGEVGRFVVDTEEKILRGTKRIGGQAEIVTFEEMIPELRDELIDGNTPPAMPTGIDKLDGLMVGMCPGELVLVAGRPGCGKTAMMLQIALNTAKTGKRGAILSLEMRRMELMKRAVANLAKIDSKKMRSRSLSEGEKIEASATMDVLGKLPLSFFALTDPTPGALRAAALRLAPKGLDILFVDYLQLMDSEGENRNVEVSRISRAMKLLANELGIPVVALSQLSRETVKNDEPQLHHLRDSGSLEQDANIVLLLWPNDAKDNMSPLNCKLAKHRDGECGKISLQWIRRFHFIDNLPYVDESKFVVRNGVASNWGN